MKIMETPIMLKVLRIMVMGSFTWVLDKMDDEADPHCGRKVTHFSAKISCSQHYVRRSRSFWVLAYNRVMWTHLAGGEGPRGLCTHHCVGGTLGGVVQHRSQGQVEVWCRTCHPDVRLTLKLIFCGVMSIMQSEHQEMFMLVITTGVLLGSGH